MKSLLDLFLIILDESGMHNGISTLHDRKTVMRRFEHEGLSFLTITLPAYASDFQKSLDAGQVAPDLFLGFKRKAGLPDFLRGFLELVFERGTGRLLDEPSHAAVNSIRQICMSFGKILIACSEERVEKALRGFIETEASLKVSDNARSQLHNADFERIAFILFKEVLATVDKLVYDGDILPKHGPGATADRLKGNQKYVQKQWTQRLEEVFPARDHLVPVMRSEHDLDHVSWLGPGMERPVKVTPVPKTLKTPRLIAIEPTCMQYMQQGLMEPLVDAIECHQTLGRMIGFTDQVPNRQMAELGSRVGGLATLDLSEASDRVSNQLVRLLFHRFPFLGEGVDATRSRKADVPGHGVIRLAKFASMGSALTFPIEAMCFLTCIFVGIEHQLLKEGRLNRQLTSKDIESFVGLVRVYGDDIIIPVEFVETVVSTLETFGFKVNTGKSFWNGSFRESCGGDFFDGQDVTPVRVRREIPVQRSDAEGIASLVSTRNQFYDRGYWQVAAFLDDKIRKLIPFPIVEESSSLLGRKSVVFAEEYSVYDWSTQAPVVRGVSISSDEFAYELDGDSALLKWYLKRGHRPLPTGHLMRQGRGRTVRLKTTMARPY